MYSKTGDVDVVELRALLAADLLAPLRPLQGPLLLDAGGPVIADPLEGQAALQVELRLLELLLAPPQFVFPVLPLVLLDPLHCPLDLLLEALQDR